MRVLHVEDSERDSALIERELQKGFGTVQLIRVETPEDFTGALAGGPWDIIIADHRLPRFSSPAALEALQATGLDIPLIVVSGTMGVGFAVEAMRAGARDYLVKSDLVRLNSVVERELQDAEARHLQAERHTLAGEVLELLGGAGDLRSHLQGVLERLGRHAGADAGGIRLRVGADFPYFSHFGFSGGFLEVENELCVHDARGPVAGDEPGPAALACVCGAVLRSAEAMAGQVTGRGSFVTGRLGAATRPGGSAGGLPHLRGRCSLEGFESLALVPLRSGDDLVGLLQLDARTPDRFDAALVTFLEEIAPSLGLAVDRRRSQEALRVSEERYRILVETSPNGVALVKLDSTILKANRRLASLLGVAEAGALEGRRLIGFVAEEDRSRAEGELASLVARGTPTPGFVRFRHGGASFDAEVTGAMTSTEAAHAALVVVIRDVTEQRRLQARLAQSDRMASVGMLAAGVAHEINNPLTYVLCNLESLVADLPALEAAVVAEEPLELEKRTREALEGARRIREIVKDLKVFSRSGGDRLEPVSLNKAIQGAVNMTHNEVKYRARLVADYGVLPPVLASEGRLAQVFLNLLVNAAQAIREGDVERNTITVRTWREGDSVLAEVGDTGSGMSEEVRKHAFEPFFTTKPAGLGTGLGLAISRGIVEEAGGQLTVESAPGQGTRFLVRLPAAADQPPAPTPPAAKPPGQPGLRRGRILVVDDEVFVRAVVVRLLRGEHDLVEVGSGHEAEVLLAKDDRFDVILTDLLMPEVAGMELYEGLLATRPDLAARVVFMSGGVFTQQASTFLEGLSNIRIEKPIDSTSLRQVVRALVAARGAG